ncbi:MAG: 4Fe-4S binding protein [Richelia sp.]|nr:4Fe-4S binding protein [Richelia sp.]
MTYKITSECISCYLCQSVCPTGAIKLVDNRLWIDPNLCQNCADSLNTVPQCQASCPTNYGCVQESTDYWENWFATYSRFLAKLTKKQDYWDKWFNFYSQKFSEQLQEQQCRVVGVEP